MVEDEKLIDSEAVDKVRGTGDSEIIIGDILCLFTYVACPLFLLLLEWRSQLQIDHVVTIIGVALHRITTVIYSG